MLEASQKTQIMNAVDRAFDDQTKVLADLVKIPSTRFKEAPAQDMMARLFKEDRLSIDRWQIKIDDLKHLHKTLGVDRVVFTQPSTYGTDNRCTLEAIAALGLDLIATGSTETGLMRGEAGVAMLWAKGSARSALRSGMFIAEMLFRHGEVRKANPDEGSRAAWPRAPL